MGAAVGFGGASLIDRGGKSRASAPHPHRDPRCETHRVTLKPGTRPCGRGGAGSALERSRGQRYGWQRPGTRGPPAGPRARFPQWGRWGRGGLHSPPSSLQAPLGPHSPAQATCSMSPSRSPVGRLPGLHSAILRSAHGLGLLPGGFLPTESTAHASSRGRVGSPARGHRCFPLIRQLDFPTP